eukprot:352818-Chlamydomonas_euryale.AAC.4
MAQRCTPKHGIRTTQWQPPRVVPTQGCIWRGGGGRGRGTFAPPLMSSCKARVVAAPPGLRRVPHHIQ